MKQIEQTEKKQTRGGRILFKILAAAAIISLTTVTVSAAEYIFGAGDWFRGRMNDQLQKDMAFVQEEGLNMTVQETVSQGQVEVANALGQNFKEQSITSNGMTMTMKAAYGDAYMLHLYLQVEAPEGTVLPDGIIYEFRDRNDMDHDFVTVGEDAPYDSLRTNVREITAMPDNDPSDNKKDFTIVLSNQYIPERIQDEPGTECLDRLNDGVSKYLNITGIYEQVVNMYGDDDGYIPFATGEFTFDIGLINEAETVEIDVAGKDYGGHVVRRWSHPDSPEVHFDWCPPYDENDVHTEEWDYTVTPLELKISPLSAHYQVGYTCSDSKMSYGLAFKIVMKDGTSPMMKDQGGFIGEDWTAALLAFTNPLDLDQVDYILIGDPNVGEPVKVDFSR